MLVTLIREVRGGARFGPRPSEPDHESTLRTNITVPARLSLLGRTRMRRQAAFLRRLINDLNTCASGSGP
jgi:hypothetical protein